MSSLLNSLLSDFAASHGLPFPPDALGLEFSTGEMRVLITGHPRRPDHLLVQVQLPAYGDGVQPPPASALLFLHQINEAARFEHDWIITISTEMEIQMHQDLPVATLSESDLAESLGEGIERAETLLSLLRPMLNPDGALDSGLERSAAPGALLLRG